MTVECYSPTFLGHDLHTAVQHYPCTVPSLSRSLDAVHLNGMATRPVSLKAHIAAHRDVADLDSSRASSSEEAANCPGPQANDSSASSQSMSEDAGEHEPLLSPNEERFVMYPVRYGASVCVPLVVLEAHNFDVGWALMLSVIHAAMPTDMYIFWAGNMFLSNTEKNGK